MSLYVLTQDNSQTISNSQISTYQIYPKLNDIWTPIKLNRYDFKQLFIKTQKPVRYIRNTVHGNSIDLNGYWSTFLVYDQFLNEIPIKSEQFSLSSNAQPIENTDLTFINSNKVQKNKIFNIYNSQLIVSPIDEDSISLTLDLKETKLISKIVISHIPDERIFYDNTIEISTDGINWETVFTGEYPELYKGKSFYFFSSKNIAFVNNKVDIYDIDDSPFLKSICYQFDIDNLYQYFLVKNETINNKPQNSKNIYLYLSKEEINDENIITEPQQDLAVDFDYTNYDLEVRTIRQRYLKFVFPSDGCKITELDVRDIFGNNILQNKTIIKYSENMDLSTQHTFKFLNDNERITTTDYAIFLPSKDGNEQYIIYDLGKEYEIINAKIYPLYQNDQRLIFQIIPVFRFEISNDNKEYKIIYDAYKHGIIVGDPIGKSIIPQKFAFDYPYRPLVAQYVRFYYHSVQQMYEYIPFVPTYFETLFNFTPENEEYTNISITSNIVFKILEDNEYQTVTYKDAVYNYENVIYYLSVINPDEVQYIQYQLPTLFPFTGIRLLKDEYVNYLDNISFSIDGIHYLNVYYNETTKILPNTILMILNYGTLPVHGIYVSEYSFRNVLDQKTTITFPGLTLFNNINKILLLSFKLYPNYVYPSNFLFTIFKTEGFQITLKYDTSTTLSLGYNVNDNYTEITTLTNSESSTINIGVDIKQNGNNDYNFNAYYQIGNNPYGKIENTNSYNITPSQIVKIGDPGVYPNPVMLFKNLFIINTKDIDINNIIQIPSSSSTS